MNPKLKIADKYNLRHSHELTGEGLLYDCWPGIRLQNREYVNIDIPTPDVFYEDYQGQFAGRGKIYSATIAALRKELVGVRLSDLLPDLRVRLTKEFVFWADWNCHFNKQGIEAAFLHVFSNESLRKATHPGGALRQSEIGKISVDARSEQIIFICIDASGRGRWLLPRRVKSNNLPSSL